VIVRGTEVKAAGELAGEALSGAAGIVGDIHRGVSRRVFGMLGPVAAPVRLAHDGITTIVNGSVRTGMRAVPSGGGRALALTAPRNAPSLADDPRGALATAWPGRSACATSSASARRTWARRSSAPRRAGATCSGGCPRPRRSPACSPSAAPA
jgi:hypothetical protein